MNLANMVEGKTLLENRDQYKKIFFYRICGTGMGACACILKEAGFDVSGADQSFSPPMSTYLESTGIPYHDLSKVDKEFLQQYDLIIVGNSVPRKSEHAQLIEECGVAFTSFPAILGAYVLKNKNVIGVAGTHGKTTTTYFLTQMLENMGQSPGYFVGGIIENRPPSLLGEGKFFVIESDEYDSAYFHKFSKFQLYELNNMILTSLEFDHADIYSSIEDIEKEFRQVIPTMDQFVIANDAYPSILKLQKEFEAKNWTLYGDESPSGPKEVSISQAGSQFNLNWQGNDYTFETNIIGKHNVLNITACVLILFRHGFEYEQIKKQLPAYLW
jgi:UDP-N-acetylmuramate: L-alanyl-gamma-D-glutamyl-meso-diaminopimelate ligase